MNAKIAKKERSHETILESAKRLLRIGGISGARVADVMKGAGLTVGGFYAHFASKEALVDDALRRTSAELRARLFGGIDGEDPAGRAEAVLKRYLSAAHRDAVAEGCVFPSVVGEIAVSAPEHRESLGEEIDAFARAMEELLTARDASERRQVAMGLVALMIGGLALARALRGTKLSEEMLAACRECGHRILAARRATRHVKEERDGRAS